MLEMIRNVDWFEGMPSKKCREGKHRSKGNKPREAISYRKVPTLVQKCSYFVPIYISAVPGAFQSYQDKSFDLRCHVWMLHA